MNDIESLKEYQIRNVTSSLEDMHERVRVTYEHLTPPQRRAQVGEDLLMVDKYLMDLTIEVNRLIALVKGE